MYKALFFIVFFMFHTFAIAQNADYIFHNVNIISMKDDEILINQSIAVKDGKILDIASKTKYKSERNIDTKGKYLLPTMADAHVHFPENDKEFEKVMKLNLINGVTKLRSMRGNWDDVERKLNYNDKGSYYPKLYFSPPPIRRSYDFSFDELEKYVKIAKEYNFDFIKILSIKDNKTLKNLVKLSEKYEVKIGGHFPVNSQDFMLSDELIFSTNYTSTEHLGGLIAEPDSLESRISYIINNDVYVCPTLQWYAIGYGQYEINEMLNQAGMEYISDSVKENWAEGTKKYRAKLGKEAFATEKQKYAKEMQERFDITKRLNDEGVKLLLRPDSSSKFIVSGFGIFEEIKLYKKAGLSNFDILKAATVNFASLFNENYGLIDVGAEADFMLLTLNPLENIEALQKIDAIYFNGQYLDKTQLDEIAKSALLD